MVEDSGMPTRIVFGSGTDVTVDKGVREVRQRLSEDKINNKEPFTLFNQAGSGNIVLVAVEQVAYLEEVAQIDPANFRITSA
jgi:hypothetical protein